MLKLYRRLLASAARAVVIVFMLFAHVYSMSSSATTLDQFSPRPITGYPWSDAWYYYINDPDVGYYKIVFLSYLNEDTEDNKPHAYLHVVFAPLEGEKRQYDYYYDNVQAKPVAGDVPWAFEFNVPGAAKISEKRIELTLPDVEIAADFSSQHLHYSTGDNPGDSPFGWITSLPFVENQWFVFSMATDAKYAFKDAQSSHQGDGLTYIDRGWNDGQAAGMIYLMAVSEDVKMMFTGGVDGNLPLETWVGRLITPRLDLQFTPSIDGMDTDSRPSPCEASMALTMHEDDYRVEINADAALSTFYNHVTPSLTVFHSPNAVMKSMQARTTIKVFHKEALIETLHLPQSILEFGGVHYCDQLLGKGLAEGRDRSVQVAQ